MACRTSRAADAAAAPLVRVVGERIELARPLRFEFQKTTLRPESLPLLDAVAELLSARDDIAMAFLDDSPHSTHCPHKGDATYFSIHAKSGVIADAGWSYESPKDAVARIRDHIAFYPVVTVES